MIEERPCTETPGNAAIVEAVERACQIDEFVGVADLVEASRIFAAPACYCLGGAP